MVAVYPVAGTALTARFWVIAAAAVLGMAVAMELGFWQLSRAAEKRALQQAMDDRAARPPLDNVALVDAGMAPDAMHRRVNLRGRWLGQYTVYLDNRQMDGKPGFFLLTPLQLDGAPRTVVMVQRGWVPRDFINRAALPELPQTGDVVQIEGRIAPPPSKLFEFEAQARGNIRQNLDLVGFAQETNLPLAGYSVLQTGPQSDGLRRDWAPIQTGVAKHHGYAFQWFALGALILVLFVWFQIVRRFFFTR